MMVPEYQSAWPGIANARAAAAKSNPAALFLSGLLLMASSGFVTRSSCAEPAAAGSAPQIEQPLRAVLDAPLLFVKRHSYTGIHIYDTFYKWPPGGGVFTSSKIRPPRARNGRFVR